MNGMTFEQWVQSEEASSTLDYEDRIALYEFAKQNPELISSISGPADIDIAEAEKYRENVIYNTPTYNSKIKLSGKVNTANDDLGDNFKITYNGKTYKVEKGRHATADIRNKITAEFKDMNSRDPDHGDVVVYQGKLYMYLPDNNTDTNEWTIVQGRKLNQDDMYALLDVLELERYNRDAQSKAAQDREDFEKTLYLSQAERMKWQQEHRFDDESMLSTYERTLRRQEISKYGRYLTKEERAKLGY
jgi:hypothetical protein